MPQLDIATYSSQLFWLTICFISLYIFTLRVSVPRISKIMEIRWQRIEGSLKRADEFKKQADETRETFEASIKLAREKSHENLSKKINEVHALMAARKQNITEMMAARLHSSEEHISRKKEEVLADLKPIAEEVVMAAIEKLTTQKIDRTDVQKTVKQLMERKVA